LQVVRDEGNPEPGDINGLVSNELESMVTGPEGLVPNIDCNANYRPVLVWVPLPPQHGTFLDCGWMDGLQQWMIAANILNKQPWTNDKGSSSLGVRRGANNSLTVKGSLL
jgi:hypothetical protein